MVANRKHNYEGMFEGTPFVLDKIDRKKKVIYFYDGKLLCCTSLARFPPKTRGIKIAVDKTEAFKIEASIRHSGKYTYDNCFYVKSEKEISVTCTIHGDFKSTPHEHLSKLHGCCFCQKEGQVTPQDVVLSLCQAKHGDRYKYDFTNYKGVKSKTLLIHCEDHGNFYQSAYNHYMMGQGCRQCSKLVMGGKSMVDHVKSSERYLGLSSLYLLRCFLGEESFYKIGISVTGVKGRYNRSNMPYSYDIVSEVRMLAENTWKSEELLKKQLAVMRYTPIQKFRGYTECFQMCGDVLDLFTSMVELQTTKEYSIMPSIPRRGYV